MRKDDVPQDEGVLGIWHEISYAVNKEGKYVQVPSAGWEPANVANELARRQIRQQIEEVRQQVKKGALSPLAYHMIRNNMDERLLSQYTGIPKKKVRCHLTPKRFKALNRQYLKRYADALDLSIDDLGRI